MKPCMQGFFVSAVYFKTLFITIGVIPSCNKLCLYAFNRVFFRLVYPLILLVGRFILFGRI